MRKEKGLLLNKEQQETLDQLIGFEDEDDEPISYIDEIPQPSEPWFEIVRRIVPRLLLEKYKTSDIHYEVIGEGWPQLVECLQTFGKGLYLPQGIENVIDVVPVDLQHKLWLQYCYDDVLGGLGQEEEITLEDKDQQHRIIWFIDRLKKHKDSVQFLDLTLEKLLNMVILTKRDEKIFIQLMLEKLKLKSVNDRIADVL